MGLLQSGDHPTAMDNCCRPLFRYTKEGRHSLAAKWDTEVLLFAVNIRGNSHFLLLWLSAASIIMDHAMHAVYPNCMM